MRGKQQAAREEEQQGVPSNPDVVMVEIYENQQKSSMSGWVPDAERPWSLPSGVPCPPPEEYPLPLQGEVYCWSSNWKLDKRPRAAESIPSSSSSSSRNKDGTSGGEGDGEGWNYASRYARFADPNRQPKPEARWNDGFRRRLWSRTMRKEFSKGSGIAQLQMADMSRVIPRMQHGLEKINEARKKIELIMKQAPQAAQSDQMLANIMSVRKTIADITSILDQLEKAQSPGSAHTASIKKLRREVAKEELAIEKALAGGRASGSVRGSDGFGVSSSAQSSPFSSAKSLRDGAGGSGSLGGSISIKSGSRGAFNPSLVASSNNDELNPDDGCFVDQTMHERLIAQKLFPVDEASVMQEIIDERNEEIAKLHKGIVEINEMFVDLSRIVGEQGGLIESIWTNVDEGNVTTKNAFKHIVAAERTQRGGNCSIS